MRVRKINITFTLSLAWKVVPSMSAVLLNNFLKDSEVPGNSVEINVYFSQRCGRHCWWQVN